MKQTVFKGIATALVTPMTATGVDYDALARLIDFQLEEGIHAGHITLRDIRFDEHYAIVEFTPKGELN